MVEVAVCGAGTWGKNHVRNFASLKGAKLVAVCDPSAKALERARTIAPDARATTRYEDVLEAADVRAVVLATPAVDHARHAKAALEAGKDVLVEKPMALRARDAEELCEIAEARGRVLMVGHLMLYHPGTETLQALIRSGELGDIYYVYSVRVNLGTLRRDENALWSFAPHDISVILALLGQAPADVAARGMGYLQPAVEDVVFVNLRFADRKMAQIQLSWLDPHKTRRLTVVGSKKMAVFDDTQPSEMIRIHDKGFDAPPDYGSFSEFLTLRDGDIRIPRVPMREPLSVECAHFVECVESRATPRSSGREGLAVVRVLEAAQKSLEAGGVPVAL